MGIKNYNVESASGRSNFARNIEKQYYQRTDNQRDAIISKRVPDNNSTTGHIFREAEEHIPNTPKNF
ncbi:MAG: hypothetical protein HDQ97_11175 [Lachnospiraceae bacterium]|nr:hypothetical protein [Lachnospiraceae bacterium]